MKRMRGDHQRFMAGQPTAPNGIAIIGASPARAHSPRSAKIANHSATSRHGDENLPPVPKSWPPNLPDYTVTAEPARRIAANRDAASGHGTTMALACPALNPHGGE